MIQHENSFLMQTQLSLPGVPWRVNEPGLAALEGAPSGSSPASWISPQENFRVKISLLVLRSNDQAITMGSWGNHIFMIYKANHSYCKI